MCLCGPLWFVCAFYLRLIRGQRPWKACYIFCHRSAGAKGYATKDDDDDGVGDCIRQTCSTLLCSLLWQFFSMFASVWPAPLCWILIKINYIKCSKQTANSKRELRTTDIITDIRPSQSPAEPRKKGWVIDNKHNAATGQGSRSVSDAAKPLTGSSLHIKVQHFFLWIPISWPTCVTSQGSGQQRLLIII